jgi:putative Mn2+ efflux pump MntP
VTHIGIETIEVFCVAIVSVYLGFWIGRLYERWKMRR